MKLLQAFVGAIALVGATPCVAQSSFYAGKTLTILVGYGPGGGFAANAQVLSQYLGNHLAGRPSVVLQYMPGASSLVASNYMYNKAKPDGLTIAFTSMFAMYTGALFKMDNIQFDLAKWEYVGNMRSGNQIFLMRSDKSNNLEDIKASNKKAVLGYSTKGQSSSYFFGMAVDEGLGAKLNHVFGYGGGGEIDLALQRGEIDGRIANLNSYVASKPDWIKTGFVKILAQAGMTDDAGLVVRDTRISDVPTLRELFPDNKTVAEIMDFIFVGELLSGVFVAPPGTPSERMAELRTAFLATLKDPQFVAETTRLDLDITPMGASQVREIVRKGLALTPEAVARLKKMSEQ